MNYSTNLYQKLEKIILDTPGEVSLCFYDINSNWGFDINGRVKMRSASTIKILILAELMRQWEEKKLNLFEKISVPESGKTGGDGIIKEFSQKHEFSLEELAICMIILSDNEATNLLIDRLGMENINDLAARLQLRETYLGRKMMDQQAKKSGKENFICGEDLKNLFLQMYQKTLISKRVSEKMLDILKRQIQGERITREIDQDLIFAHKCGDLEGLEHDAGILFLEEGDYILVILTDNMSSNLEARQKIGKMSKIIYNAVRGRGEDTVYLTGESKTNMNNAITKMYGSFFLAFELEQRSGKILRADSNATLQLTKDFIAQIFVGKLISEKEEIVGEITRRYFGSSAKAIIAAYHDALKHFENLSLQ